MPTKNESEKYHQIKMYMYVSQPTINYRNLQGSENIFKELAR